MGALMGRRKGEPTAAGIDRGWPHQVVVPATECTGSHGRFMEAFCLDLCVREASQRLSRGQVVIVYCFADPEHAKKFRVRFAANGSIRKIEAAAPAGAVVSARLTPLSTNERPRSSEKPGSDGSVSSSWPRKPPPRRRSRSSSSTPPG